MAKLLVQRQRGSDLGVLQQEMENAAKALKAARAALNTAQQTEKKAEEAYAVAQRSLAAGVTQVQAATKV